MSDKTTKRIGAHGAPCGGFVAPALDRPEAKRSAIRLGALALGIAAIIGVRVGVGGRSREQASPERSPRAVLPQDLRIARGDLDPRSVESSRGDRLADLLRRECSGRAWAPNEEWEQMLHSISASELGRLISMLRDLVLDPSQEELGHALLARWGELNPRGALRFAQGLGDSGQHASVWRSIFDGWTKVDAGAAFVAAQNLPAGALTIDLLARAAVEWSRVNPRLAFAAAQEIPPGDVRDYALQATIGRFATEDAAAALDYVRSVAAPTDRDELLFAVATGMAEGDPQLAAAFANALPPGPLRLSAIAAVASELAAKDGNEVLAWANALTDAEGRRVAYEQIAGSLARQDVAVVAAWAMTLSETSGRAQVLTIAIDAWLQQDEKAAAAWVRQLPDGAIKGHALAMIANRSLTGR